MPYAIYRSEQCRRDAEARFGGAVPLESDYASPYPVTLGIFSDTSHYFAHHVAACREMKVAYRVLDLAAHDWISRILQSGCGAFLASPSTLRSIDRRVHEERLWVAAGDLGLRLCPSFQELWLWESKRRMREWLAARGVPHPATEIFLDRDAAEAYLRSARYPLVIKTDASASANGVFVVRTLRRALGLCGQAFGRGIIPRNTDPREAQAGCLIVQEYIPHDHEWRIVRIGDDYLCRRKGRVGDYASGSGTIEWAEPPAGALDFVERITDLGGFHSMAVDLFAAPAGGDDRYLVNEMQALIGPIVNTRLRNAHTGRWSRGPSDWEFTPGFFYQNACANLRAAWLARTVMASRGLEGGPVAQPEP